MESEKPTLIENSKNIRVKIYTLYGIKVILEIRTWSPSVQIPSVQASRVEASSPPEPKRPECKHRSIQSPSVQLYRVQASSRPESKCQTVQSPSVQSPSVQSLSVQTSIVQEFRLCAQSTAFPVCLFETIETTFWVISSDLVTWIFHTYIFTKFFWKILKTEKYYI